jgi:fructosamine-3-kinase
VRTFVKRNPDAPAGFFEAEAAGLAWLRSAGGVRTAQVIRQEPGEIELEYVAESAPAADTARTFGRDLASTHRAGASAFGVSPDGATGPLFIGARTMPAASDATWGGFYARDRVLPFLEIAVRSGGIDNDGAELVRRACRAIAAGIFDDDGPPARIHGDLWAGNVLWGSDGVVLIDPAAHGGHRETDLAMLALFGCPYLDHVVEAYDAEFPLRDGWRDRTPLHQLHPLAVHAAGHGRSYGRALAAAAGSVLSLDT